MAIKQQISTKRLAISKANTQVVVTVAVAAFLTVFSLVAAKTVFSQNRYDAKVIKAKEKAHSQLQKNIKAYDSLVDSYKTFNGKEKNVIGGSAAGTGDNDGSNSKIVLDALPSSYDFPALTSSLEKILTDRGLKVSSITGTDDQLNQQANSSSPTPQAVPIPFSFTITDANYESVSQLIAKLQQSIRPIQIDSITLTGGTSSMTLLVNAHTSYQPAISLKVIKKEVK